MPDRSALIELAIDTAGSMASIALSHEGIVLAELTWHTHNNHSAELIPAVEALLARTGHEREEIGVLFVNRGPGSYAGLRVGISTAMGLALGLGADLLSAGRLELDAYLHAAFPGPICALHQAGRGDIAWAVYTWRHGDWVEIAPPRLTSLAALVEEGPREALYCGELEDISIALTAGMGAVHLAGRAASLRRAGALAELGWKRYQAGARDNPMAVEPLYLREPAITAPKAAHTS